MFLQKFEMDQDGVDVIFNPMKDLANHLKQTNPICSVANCPNIYNKIETHGNCGVALCKDHIKDGMVNKEKIWRLFVAGEDQGDYTNLQIMSFMHDVLYNGKYITIEFALIDNTDKLFKRDEKCL